MKIAINLLFAITVCFLVAMPMFGQSLKNLEDNNGFKTYKLGAKYYMGYGIKNKEDGADKVVISYTKDKIGDIDLKSIELYYLKDTLSKIIIRLSPEYYQKLLEGCKNSFGPPTQDLSIKVENSKGNIIDHYIWKTKKFSLEYYYSYPKFGGGGYDVKDLYLDYRLNDYLIRQQRVKKGNYTSKKF